MSEPLGMCCLITFTELFPEYRRFKQTVLRNVTEIHWRYPGLPSHTRVAFESDIHGTGITFVVEWTAEFEAVLETERAAGFYEDAASVKVGP